MRPRIIGRRLGDLFILADKLADDVFKQARVVSFEKVKPVAAAELGGMVCQHPLKPKGGYDFDVPLLSGEHVTDDAGTGFVHTAPGHGREDFEVWTEQCARAGKPRHQHRDPLHRR